MSIQKDAGEILLYFYKKYSEGGNRIGTEDVIKETKWESGKINRAIDYLRDLNLIKIDLFLGNKNGVYNFIVWRPYPEGINIIENKKEFKTTFGFGINLGIFNFSWEREKDSGM